MFRNIYKRQYTTIPILLREYLQQYGRPLDTLIKACFLNFVFCETGMINNTKLTEQNLASTNLSLKARRLNCQGN